MDVNYVLGTGESAYGPRVLLAAMVLPRLSNFKPSPRLTISTGPNWNRSRQAAQYVRSVIDSTAASTYGGRFVFGELEQSQLTLQTRVTTLLTPKVSLTIFMQPLLATGAPEPDVQVLAVKLAIALAAGNTSSDHAGDLARLQRYNQLLAQSGGAPPPLVGYWIRHLESGAPAPSAR